MLKVLGPSIAQRLMQSLRAVEQLVVVVDGHARFGRILKPSVMYQLLFRLRKKLSIATLS